MDVSDYAPGECPPPIPHHQASESRSTSSRKDKRRETKSAEAAGDMAALTNAAIQVGVPLAFDVYDVSGRLLLHRGFVITSESQLARLIKRGAYADPGSVSRVSGPGSTEAERTPAVRKQDVSVFKLAEAVQSRLRAILEHPPEDGSFATSLLGIAAEVQRCATLDADVAIACIQLLGAQRHSVKHAFNVALVAELIGRQLQYTDEARRSIVAAALTMNVAMMQLHETLYAQRERPSAEQMRVVRAHPQSTVSRLQLLGVTDTVWLTIVLQHHEESDGSGYPNSLAGDQIAVESRVVSAADQFCSLVSERINRPGELPNVALRRLLVERRTIDARIAAVLVREIGIYPPGTLLRLKNGDLALSMRRTLDPRHPVVRGLETQHQRVLAGFPKRLTNKPWFEIAEAVPRNLLTHPVDFQSIWDTTTWHVSRDD